MILNELFLKIGFPHQNPKTQLRLRKKANDILSFKLQPKYLLAERVGESSEKINEVHTVPDDYDLLERKYNSMEEQLRRYEKENKSLKEELKEINYDL